LLLDLSEETRSLSPAKFELRALAHERLTLAIRTWAAHRKQRGKQKAIKESDSNTAFFHAHATQRLQRNHIRGVEVDGTMVSPHHGKVAALTAHFKQVMGEGRTISENFVYAAELEQICYKRKVM
jgi:kynurenine formamidase